MRHTPILMIMTGLAVSGLSSTAEASEAVIRVTNFVSVAGYCEATFTRNPAVIPDVDNINIKIGGPFGMAPPDPGFWHIDSPALAMADAGTGVHVTEFENGVPVREYDESNTAVHNGPFVPGTWTVALLNNMGATCSDYDDHVRVTFTLIP